MTCIGIRLKSGLLNELMQSNYVLKAFDTVLFDVGIPFANNTFIIFFFFKLILAGAAVAQWVEQVD